MRVLLVEDDLSLSEALEYILKKEGYQVDAAANGNDGEVLALSGLYNGIILDRMLPGKDGMLIMKSIRQMKFPTPTMFLTARDTVNERVDGLEAGADDYLVKPFSNKEFLARVKALIRRSNTMLETDELVVSNTMLDIKRCTYEIDNKILSLTKKETLLLELLLRNLNHVLQKEQILEHVWGFNNDIEIGNVDLYIYYLRKKVDFMQSHLRLQTIRGIGYSLVQK